MWPGSEIKGQHGQARPAQRLPSPVVHVALFPFKQGGGNKGKREMEKWALMTSTICGVGFHISQ